MNDALDHVVALVRERDLDRYLASLYAAPATRAGLFALHALDLELAEVARSTTEPMLGQIRLAWWREQLQALDAGARPAQPVLAALAEHLLPAGISGASLEPLEDAWLALLEDDVEGHAKARGRLFGAAVELLLPGLDSASAQHAHRMGVGWAIVDVARNGVAVGDDMLARADEMLSPTTVAAPARTLAGLAALARRDLASWQRGRMPGARGTPGRQARLAWSILTGR